MEEFPNNRIFFLMTDEELCLSEFPKKEDQIKTCPDDKSKS